MSRETDRRFDVVIVDSTDPQGPGAVLFTEEFYAGVKRCLKPGGVMVTQNGVPFFQPDELTSSVSKFRKLFADGGCYIAAIPTYVGGHLAMGWATDDKSLRDVSVETLTQRYESRWQLLYEILDAGGASRGLRVAALHCRSCCGGEIVLAARRAFWTSRLASYER